MVDVVLLVAESLEMLIENMVTTVCKERLKSPEEVGAYPWRVLLRAYRQVGKTLWDEWVADVQKAEIGTARAISLALGGKKTKLQPLPAYEEVRHDPWAEPQKKRLSERMRKYHEANNIPIPPGYE